MPLKGRAAHPVRPGFLIKNVLSGKVPLITEPVKGKEEERIVNEAVIIDLHFTYKKLVGRENALRPKERQLKPMVYSSFVKYPVFARLLGLIEYVRDEPMVSPPPGGPLYRVDKPDGVHVVESTRRVIQLTSDGREDEVAWGDLCRAWREGWKIPSKLPEVLVAPPEVEVPPPVPPKVPKRPPEEVPTLEWKSLKITGKPTRAKLKSLLRHLRILRAVGVDDEAVKAEVNHLAMGLGDWEMELEDDIVKEEEKTKPRADVITSKTVFLSNITFIREALYEREIAIAIGRLEEIT